MTFQSFRLLRFATFLFVLAMAQLLHAEQYTGQINSTRVNVPYPPDGKIYVEAAYEITDSGRQWYDLYCLMRLDSTTALKQADGKDFLRKWPWAIYTPDNSPSRWSGSTIEITYADLETSANLPRNKRSTMFATLDLYHAGKWCSNGWPMATPIFVTTNADGKIISVETFNTDPAIQRIDLPAKKRPALACELMTKELKLKPDASLSQIVGLKGEDRLELVADRMYGEVEYNSPNPGEFFAPIDTPGKALELVQLQLRGGTLIKSNAQYESLLQEFNKAGILDKASLDKMHSKDDIKGFSITEEPGVGYRVGCYLVYSAYGIVYCQFNIGLDGRQSRTELDLYRAPQGQNANEPGSNNPVAIAANEAGAEGAKKYQAVLKSTLTDEGSQIIAPLFKVTDRKIEIPEMR